MARAPNVDFKVVLGNEQAENSRFRSINEHKRNI